MTMSRAKLQRTYDRRQFISKLSGVIASPAIITPAHSKYPIIDGIASGDVTENSAVIWGRTNRIARMLVEWSTTPKLVNSFRTAGPLVTLLTISLRTPCNLALQQISQNYLNDC